MNITLIGMAGAGKSTIGIELAKHYNYTFIDNDTLIEQSQGHTIQHIINEVGEREFLKIEEEAVLQMGDLTDTIIAPGGSIIYIPKVMDYLKSISTLIFIDTPYEVIQKRVNPSSRGVIGLKNKSLNEVYIERLPLYNQYADIQIPCPENTSIQEIMQTIQEKLHHHKSQ